MDKNNKLPLLVISLGLIIATNFAWNVAFIDWGLPGLWHPDEVTKFSATMYFDKTLNPNWFVYPSLQIYIIYFLAVLPVSFFSTVFDSMMINPSAIDAEAAIELIRSETTFYARLITATMGSLAVFFTYVTARELFDRKAAIIAALLLATSAGFVGLSHFATVEIPLSFWLIVGFYFTVRAFDSDKSQHYYLAAGLIGLAISTKYSAILSIPIIFLAYILDSNCAQIKISNVRTKVFNMQVLGIGFAVLFGFLVGTPFAIISPLEFLKDFVQIFFYLPDYGGGGQSSYISHLANILNYSGIFNFCIFLAGLGWGLTLLLRHRQPKLFLLILFIALYYYELGGMSFHPPRYIVPILPFLAILGAKLCIDLSGCIKRVPLVKWSLVSMFAVGVGFSVYYTTMGVIGIANDDRNLAFRWILENVDPGEKVEISPAYSLNVPAGYASFAELPQYHVKPSYTRLNDNELYVWLSEIYIRLKDDSEIRNDRAIDKEDVLEPESVGLTSLLKRRPRYLVLSQSHYRRFIEDDLAAELFPLQHDLYTSILSDNTPYQLVIDFQRSDSLLRPNLEFIDAGVSIFRMRDQ